MAMNILGYLLATVVAGGFSGLGQQDAPEHQFDFWVGEWKCSGETTAADGKKEQTKATNSITREFGGKVIHEHFSSKDLKGMSVSVYDVNAKMWRQTWVDDSGSFLSFIGGFADGKMELTLVTRKENPVNFARMVFHNIEKNSFDWEWEKTTDSGKTWNNAWHLHYVRKGK